MKANRIIMARSSVDGQPIWAVLVCNRIELRYPHGHAVVARKYETYVRINSAILKAHRLADSY